MKNLYLLILTFLISSASIAQNGINYKALIKDANGDVVANQAVTVQFQILEDGTTNVYQETHNPTTDTNGIAIVNIGEGTVISGNYSMIDWGGAEHYINVQIDTGAGLVDLGTTQFKSVPYALMAENVKDAPFEKIGNVVRHADESDFLFGAAAQDYTSNIGTETKFFFNADTQAFRGGKIANENWDAVNLGEYSFAYGLFNKVTGDGSVSFGIANDVSGGRAFAHGSSNILTDFGSVAFGASNNLSGVLNLTVGVENTSAYDYTSQLGLKLVSGRAFQTVLGEYNTVSSTALFQIGNGDLNTTSTLFSIEDDGAIISDFYKGTGERLIATDLNGKLIPTTIELPSPSSGLESIIEGGNNGWRLIGKNSDQYGDIGNLAIDLSTSTTFPDTAHGATGDFSFATGWNTIASGSSSFATGFESEATGSTSTAFGYKTKANAAGCTAVGTYNIGGGVAGNFISTNPLFEVGNGNSSTPSNALTVLKNGKVGIGKHTGMEATLEIESNSTTTQPQLALIEDNASFSRLRFKNTNRNGDDYWDIAGFIGTTQADDRLNFFNSDGGDIMSIEGDGDVRVNGSVVHSSDRRLKKDVETLEFGIAEILKLNPVQYNWKDKADKPHKSLGVIAQEIQEIIPNVVQKGIDNDETLSVSYTELIPVLIKAIQEQQAIINAQEIKIETQDDKYASLEKMVLALASQVNMDRAINNTNEISEAEKE